MSLYACSSSMFNELMQCIWENQTPNCPSAYGNGDLAHDSRPEADVVWIAVANLTDAAEVRRWHGGYTHTPRQARRAARELNKLKRELRRAVALLWKAF